MHVHVKLPNVLLHVAFALQLLVPPAHSFTSEHTDFTWLVLQVNPLSNAQVALQPSAAAVPPSSQASVPARTRVTTNRGANNAATGVACFAGTTKGTRIIAAPFAFALQVWVPAVHSFTSAHVDGISVLSQL